MSTHFTSSLFPVRYTCCVTGADASVSGAVAAAAAAAAADSVADGTRSLALSFAHSLVCSLSHSHDLVPCFNEVTGPHGPLSLQIK
ncbi:hypothetical protein M0802_002895 [Mischocyttarus mexicanus]|nr:hypothetical protein M0802_002895 [Mischocyttarus mexicanus]